MGRHICEGQGICALELNACVANVDLMSNGGGV